MTTPPAAVAAIALAAMPLIEQRRPYTYEPRSERPRKIRDKADRRPARPRRQR
jgi:hypothetical protein